MARTLKTFSQIAAPNLQAASPTNNSFTVDLGGLNLSADQISQVRQEAVRAALAAAATHLPQVADSFSTFSTFSTFGSGAARGLPEMNLPGLSAPAQNLIGRVVAGGG